MRVFFHSLQLLCLGWCVAVSAPAHGASDLKDRAEALGLTPHKALYSIRLAATHSGSQIINISGQMLYEWQPTCDAWISNHRFNIMYEYADSMPMSVLSDFSTYETFDGAVLNFTSQRKRESEVFEELRGQASTGPKGGKAEYTLPEALSFDLPAGAVFPMGHTVALAEKIKAGKKFYNSVLFDGSDEEGPVEVNTFIGGPVTETSPHLKQEASAGSIDETLMNSPARHIRMAFFPLQQKEAMSDYEMSMILQENGIIREMEIEYDDFTIAQELVAVEPMKDACKKRKRYNQ